MAMYIKLSGKVAYVKNTENVVVGEWTQISIEQLMEIAERGGCKVEVSGEVQVDAERFIDIIKGNTLKVCTGCNITFEKELVLVCAEDSDVYVYNTSSIIKATKKCIKQKANNSDVKLRIVLFRYTDGTISVSIYSKNGKQKTR